MLQKIQSKKSTGYAGHKAAYGSFQNIINEFPPHDYFISAFAGNCAVLQNKKPGLIDDCGFEVDLQVITDYWLRSGYRIFAADFISWFRINNTLSPSHLIYADPPYLFSTRSSGARIYKHELTNSDHSDLLQLFLTTRARVAISHYRCELYDSMLQGWRYKEWKVMSRVGVRMEGLYMNYSKPKQLHQYNLLGDNFTERQQLKRMSERWLNKIKSLPDQRKHMLLKAVLDYIKSPES